ncbi:Protein of unknown function [Flavobacterium glycines]|uniref:DUF3826 domain-containing protein n=2 Tax=Flavobacterium glycines TaxID=551990 RepID=A0A511CJJ3_9FLAO|nr:DUF3826 domain-containing protein [Flavobacterium glycines]GEL10518.1 hypothetical protein FGL01_12570 [Flavobacterium glycines]SDI64878.1 Protein of unknown function [Flavobacterium glycines]
MKMYKKLAVGALFLFLGSSAVLAQSGADAEYVKVTNERAQKIVDDLKLNSKEDQLAVRDIIAEQYRSLNKIHETRDAKIAEIKKTVTDKEKQQKEVDGLKNDADKKILSLHKSYLKKLSKKLNNSQIVQVKDGMTYGVLPITVLGYNDMLPNLTNEQKKYIYDALVEAREHAMDGGSSKEKHGWFGKYKGRINNYLSKQGYDLNKESADWHKRLEEREKNKK